VNALGFAKTLRQLASIPSKVSKRAAEAFSKRLAKQFADGAGPYGAGWKALADGSPSHLIASNTMAPQVKATAMSGAGVALQAPTPANFHQSGTRRMDPRKVLPDNGLPASWRADLQEIYSAELREGLGQ